MSTFRILAVVTLGQTMAAKAGFFDVRDYGAMGDAKILDAVAVGKAIEACAQASGG